jgi:hypothetical protein
MQLTPALLGVAACAAVLSFSSGCGKRSTSDGSAQAADKKDWVQTTDATPDERTYLTYGRSVIEAVANRDYAQFHNELSSHARARISLNQFAPEDEGAAFDKHEKQPRLNVSSPEFVKLMERTEAQLGQPQAPLDLHVHSTDAKALSGAKAQGIDAIDAMFAIGNMPASIPAAIRKASLRAKIAVQLSAAELAETAKAQSVSVEELQKDPDFRPYLTLKLVLVEEAEQLRVGYFEFLPPSMMD